VESGINAERYDFNKKLSSIQMAIISCGIDKL
jgi:hypothetical protein